MKNHILRKNKSEQIRFQSVGEGFCHSQFWLDVPNKWVQVLTIEEANLINPIKFKEITGLDYPLEKKDALAYVSNENQMIWIVLRPESAPEIIAHECFHVVFMIFDVLNMKIVEESEEIGALLMGSVYKNVSELHKLHVRHLKTIK